ncbi:MAG TPA: alpha-L-fucosidase [Streptosporangiaceae bacterium]|nr:alpha-L-fucosidase [Streptosporangiaceae bacterium]
MGSLPDAQRELGAWTGTTWTGNPPGQLIRMLVDGVPKDGNLLLNVGPTGRGEFEPRAVEMLEAIGAWMDHHGRSIYGAGPAPYTPPPDARY